MMKRIVSLTMLLLAVMLAFSGCAKKTAKATLSLPETIVAAEGGNLSPDDLKAVGEMLKSVYDDTDFDVRDWLIAAQRGYDMTAEGFDDSAVDPTVVGAADLNAALNVLNKANDKASDKNKIDKSIYVVYNEDGSVKAEESLNEADLNQLVNNFKTKVDTEAKNGLWDKILCAIGVCLGWITRYLGFGSYIVGICIFAILVEILMLPFAIKQQKNTIRQAKLRPKEMAIRNKYKGRTDQVTQQKVAQEIQELYQRENYSPASGCLQLLLQFPILIALYNIVIDPLHYVLGQGSGISAAMKSYYTAARAAGGLGQALSGSTNSTIALLSEGGVERFQGIANFAYFNNGAEAWESLHSIGDKIPNFNIFGINFGNTPGLGGNYILLLVPVLTFVVYFFSMRISRKFMYQPTQGEGNDRQVACSNTMMDVSMPLMSTFFAFAVPAIVGVYWMFRSVLGTLKQFIMSRVMPLPEFSEEEYKAAAREMAGKAPKKVEKSERAGTVRSLHHIDDEDYEDTRERAQKRADAIAAKEKAEQEEKAKKTPFSAPTMKPDRADEAQTEAPEEEPEAADSQDDAQN